MHAHTQCFCFFSCSLRLMLEKHERCAVKYTHMHARTFLWTLSFSFSLNSDSCMENMDIIQQAKTHTHNFVLHHLHVILRWITLLKCQERPRCGSLARIQTVAMMKTDDDDANRRGEILQRVWLPQWERRNHLALHSLVKHTIVDISWRQPRFSPAVRLWLEW